MSFFNNSIVAFDLHDEVVQFVELQKKSRTVELRSFNRVLLPKGVIVAGKIQDEEALKTAVKSLLEKANPSAVNPKKAVFMFPSKHVFTHIFKFPNSFSLKDIKKALVYEVETVVPFSVDEMVWDCSILEKNITISKEMVQTVLFAGVPKAVSEEYVRFFESFGIKPALFSIHVFAVIEALKSQIPPKKSALLIDLDPYTTSYLVLRDGVLRTILGSSDGSERFFSDLRSKHSLGDDWMDLWKKGEVNEAFLKEVYAFVDSKFEEARCVFDNTGSNVDFTTVDTIYLTGEYASLKGISDRLQALFKDKKVLIGDPKHSVTVNDQRFLAKQQKDGGSIPFSVYFLNSIGIAKHYLGGAPGVNLLPETLKKHFFLEKIEKFLLAASFVMTIGMLLISMWLLIQQQGLMQNRTILEIQKARIENTLYGTRYQEIYSALTEFNEEINELSKVDQALFSVPDTFTAILAAIPEGVRITSVHYEDESLMVQITGVSETREALLSLEKTLKTLPFVTEVFAPLSNYDEKVNVSFAIDLYLSFSDLPHYDGIESNP